MNARDKIKAENQDAIARQPVYAGKQKAIEEAIKANKKPGKNYEIWKEPNDLGGRYVVAEAEALEALYREGYKRVLGTSEIVDLGREGPSIDQIEEV